MAVSSVELTCLDLIRYVHAVGGFDAVATGLADLGDRIDGEKLAAIAAHFERAAVQRNGYLLDHHGHTAAGIPLHRQLFAQSAVPWVKLDPARRKDKIVSMDGEPAARDARWRVVAQHLPEIDE